MFWDSVHVDAPCSLCGALELLLMATLFFCLLCSDTELWILALGGSGIVVGLATYGYNIMRVLGVKCTHITPSRG
jgi:phosphate/sulfate permease